MIMGAALALSIPIFDLLEEFREGAYKAIDEWTEKFRDFFEREKPPTISEISFYGYRCFQSLQCIFPREHRSWIIFSARSMFTKRHYVNMARHFRELSGQNLCWHDWVWIWPLQS